MPLPANDPCVVIGEVISITDETRSPQYPKKRLRLAMSFNTGFENPLGAETTFTVEKKELPQLSGVEEGQIVTVSFIPSGFEWKDKLLTDNKATAIKVKDRGAAPKQAGPRPSDGLNYTKAVNPRQDDIPF